MTIAPSAPADPFVHPALFYRDDDEYLAGTVPFIADGLAAGEPVAVSVPGSKHELLRAALGGLSDQVRLLDMTQVGRNPGRIIPGVLRAFADRHPTVRARIIGEPIWPTRSDTEYPACVQHEALINHAFTGRPVTILCPYDTTGLAPHVIEDALATHPVLIDADGQRTSDRYAPDRIVADYNRPLTPPPTATMIPVHAERMSGLRRSMAENALRLGLAADRVDDLLLAASELAANSIVHGGGAGTVHLWAEDDHLVGQVSDSGHITDPLAGRAPAGPGQIGGRGLLMVNHLADLVRVHSTPEGTTVQMRFRIHGH
jgi:anti-sigma regulatory factor (Ser/Thr protein kinase)